MGLVVSSYRMVSLPPHQLVVLGRTRTPGRHGPAPAKASGFRLPLSCRPPSPPLVCRAVLVALVGWPASTPAPIKKKFAEVGPGSWIFGKPIKFAARAFKSGHWS